MIKNILFDMGGVVFRQNTAEAFRRFSELGIDPMQFMGDYGQKDFFLDLETGTIDAECFCQRLSEKIGRTVSWDEAQYCWLGFIRDVPEERLNNLLSLRKNYRVGLLSNTNPFVMAFTRSNQFSQSHRPITDFFDSFFCSYEMRVCKPDPEIYLKALEMDSMQPSETLFVDDSLKNVNAAAALGIHTLHVQPDADWMPQLETILHE